MYNMTNNWVALNDLFESWICGRKRNGKEKV